MSRKPTSIKNLYRCEYCGVCTTIDMHCECGGQNFDPNDVESYVQYLEGRVQELETKLNAYETCIVCGAELLPPNYPPHCEGTCHPNEDHEAAWEEMMNIDG